MEGDQERDESGENSVSIDSEISAPQSEIRSVKIEFEETLPDGTRRQITYTDRLELRRGRSAKGRINLPRWACLAIVAGVIILIGLIAVGPEAVWNEVKDIIPELIS